MGSKNRPIQLIPKLRYQVANFSDRLIKKIQLTSRSADEISCRKDERKKGGKKETARDRTSS